MNVAEHALKELFPEHVERRVIILKYSKAFNNYNANVKYNLQKIEFRISHEWKDVDEDIVMGLLQMLFLKMFKQKKNTMYIDLYNSFIKKLSTYTRQDKDDPILDASFERVNTYYFDGFMDKPNLVWGTDSARKLGHFEYATNTIMISTLFKEEDELLDYIMYHELLHKKLKYSTTNGRSLHHSKKFKDKEAEFANKNIEKDLEHFLKRHRLRDVFRFW
jgi:hypothetical protein